MPVPYRKTPRPALDGIVAYLDVLRPAPGRVLYGALLLIDGRGQPLEFVHNHLNAPTGFLWPEERVTAFGTVSLAHSLFDACRRDPDLLVCRDSLGSPEFCRTEIAPAIPFAQVTTAENDAPAAWGWINEPPASGMRAQILYEHLSRRGLVEEPFARLVDGLRLAYPKMFAAENPDGDGNNDESGGLPVRAVPVSASSLSATAARRASRPDNAS